MWTFYVFDRGSGTLRSVAENPGGRTAPLDGPFPQATLLGTDAYWVQGAGAGGLAAIKEYDYATRQVSTVRVGHPGGPLVYDNHFYWMESPAPDVLTQVRSTPGAPALPAELSAVLPGASSFDYANGVLVWIDSDGHTIRFWNSATNTLGQFYKAPAEDNISNVTLVGNWVVWEGMQHPWALDRTDGIVFPLTDWYGSILAGPASLLVTEVIGGAAAPKSDTPPTETFDIPANQLPTVKKC